MSTAPGAGSPVPDEVDVVVVGSGVAGLSAALGLAGTRRVLVVSKGAAGDGSTRWAQGGVAAAIRDTDDPAAHSEDTAVAGAGICDPRAVSALVAEGPSAVADLVRSGARLDRDADGRLSVTREGGHHADRVVHAGGDATGAEVWRTLWAAAGAAGLPVLEHTRVLQVLTAGSGRGRAVTGVLVESGGIRRVLAAPAVVLATGGLGHAYAASTNPDGVTGDGLALALEAGAVLADLEFVQFHPTVLWTGPSATGRLPLVSEAVRGAGAVLRDVTGAPVMAGVHPLGDLAPRDVVARAITRRLDEAPGGVGDHVLLDTPPLGPDTIARRFPTMVAACAAVGVDPAREPVPVAPAEHFLCGGIRTDDWGRTRVRGLFAVGECAATGVHGANRLASNSLLEGMVFGRRVATRLLLDPPPRLDPGGASCRLVGAGDPPAPTADGVPEDKVRAVLTRHAGIRRSGAGLSTALDLLADPTPDHAPDHAPDDLRHGRGAGVPQPLRTVARAVVLAAATRTESRGCHWRTDRPDTDPAWAGRAVVVSADESGDLVADIVTRGTS